MLHCNTYTINFINKQTNSKFDEHLRNVRYLWFRSYGWEGNYNKKFGHKNCECYISEKSQETNIIFSNWSFFLAFFSLCFFCIPYFSFTLLTITRVTKRQRKRINKASNINKVISFKLKLSSHSIHL